MRVGGGTRSVGVSAQLTRLGGCEWPRDGGYWSDGRYRRDYRRDARRRRRSDNRDPLQEPPALARPGRTAPITPFGEPTWTVPLVVRRGRAALRTRLTTRPQTD